MSECGLNFCVLSCHDIVSRCSEPLIIISSEQNSGSLEEKDLILAAEPSLHPSLFPVLSIVKTGNGVVCVS